MPDAAPPPDSTEPLDIDLYCLTCGYNLRGLPGDPIRCPECGHASTRLDLLGTPESLARRFRSLQRTLDVQSLAIFAGPVLSIPLLIWSLDARKVAPLYTSAGLLLAALITVLLTGRDIRRLSHGAGFLVPTTRYQLWTIARVVTLPALWVVCTTLALLVLAIVQVQAPGPGAFILGLILLAAGGYHWRPLARVRQRQERSFQELVRITRAGSLPHLSGNLHGVPTTASFSPAMKHDSIQDILTHRFAAAIAQIAGATPEDVDPQVRPAGDPQFGDYQCNAAMALARPLKAKPRDIAQRIKEAAEPELADIAEPLEIAGPGFINIRLRSEFLARYLGEIPAQEEATEPRSHGATKEGTKASAAADRFRHEGTKGMVADRLGLPPVEQPVRVVIDYSQPNIAKQMHVGHLRSTIIGDVLARVLALEGHEVIRQNHIGDWGTQFGMLIRWYREHPLPTPQTHGDVLEAIEQDYRAANERFDRDAQFAAEARRSVAELQGGDAAALRTWEQIRVVSLAEVEDIYQRLGVLLEPADICGESFYNPWLSEVVAEMRKRLPPGGAGGELPGVRAEVRDDAGAVCVFMYNDAGAPLFTTKEGAPLPMIIQKSDGGYNYETTDLAGLRHRIGTLGATRILYVVDAAQTPHFQMVFTAARAAGLIPPAVEVEHVKFGMVLGTEGKRIKTRTGGSIKLRELLNEAEERALGLLRSRRDAPETAGQSELALAAARSLTEAELPAVARAVGVASIKYADLRNDRTSNYVFDWDKMISFQGNTAPYMMYAYARIRSIYRKAAERFGSPNVYAAGVNLRIEHAAERALALRLARFREAIDIVAAALTPHVLCTYLYDLGADFMRFYESCPVLAAPDEASRLSRMRLCDLTARTLRLGLGLLGIDVIERM